MAKIIDTHTHIYDEQFAEDFDEVVERVWLLRINIRLFMR